jgi:acyl-CoA synthetase (AMP-forming)/AMP-acid ligase II
VNVYDYLLGQAVPDKIAVLSRNEHVTFVELANQAEQIAANLHRLGIGKGVSVGIRGENSAFWIASYLGILKLGAVAVPFPTRLSSDKLDALAERMRCVAICMENRGARQLAAQFAGKYAVVTSEGAAAGPQSDEVPASTWAGAPVSATAEITERADLAALMFTSGSTGEPNAVKVSHRNIMANTDSIIEYLGLTRDDRMMVVLPFDYCFGLSLLHTHLRVGGSVVLNNASQFAEDMLNDMERFECTGFAGVPAIYQQVLRRSSLPRRALPQLRHAQQAGGKLAPSLITEFRQALPHVRFFVMYGQTEATSRLSYLPPERLDDKLGSIGRGIPGVTLRVVDESGAPVPPGETGEIIASGENVTLGYLVPDPAKDSFRNGVLYTGDQGRVDEDGFIYLVGRISDFIKPSGHRISSKEIEDVLAEMPQVVEVAIVGIPHPDLGEAAKAFIVTRDGAELPYKQIADHCKGRLPGYAVPREVAYLRELPKNASQKVIKRTLIAETAPAPQAVVPTTH